MFRVENGELGLQILDDEGHFLDDFRLDDGVHLGIRQAPFIMLDEGDALPESVLLDD